MTKFKSKKFMFVVLMGIIACLASLVICFGQNAYAEYSQEQGFNFEQESHISLNQNSQTESVSDTNAEASEENEEKLGRDYENDCEDQRKAATKFLHDEVEGNDDNTYHVIKNKDGSVNFNIITIERNGKTFEMPYDYRGYYGNRSNVVGRKANVQYFYNSETKALNLVAFKNKRADEATGYNTMGYGSVYFGRTAFEDNIEYEDGTSYSIAAHAETINFDTLITGIMDYGFQSFKELRTVDILGQMYSQSSMSHVECRCLRYAHPMKEDPKEDTNVYMNFLEARYLNADYLMQNTSMWAEDTKVIYNQQMRGTVISTIVKDMQEDFKNINQLINLCENKFKDDDYEIVLKNDLNFCGKTLDIPEFKHVTLKLGTHKIYSYDDIESPTTMLNSKGYLQILGQSLDVHGFVEEVNGSNSTIKVSDNGNIVAMGVDFVTPRKAKDYPSHGGFFYFDDMNCGSQFLNCKFTGCAEEGGAIYINDRKQTNLPVTFKNCDFKDCKAVSGIGGAVCNNAENVNLHFYDTNFTSCSSDSHGGAIATISDYEMCEFNNCTIKNCYSADRGGVIYNNSRHSDYKFYKTKISECGSKNDGGAIYSRANYVNYYLNDQTIIDSCYSKTLSGGAFYIRSCYCKIIGSESKDGKKIKEYSNLTNDCTISNCITHNSGAAGAITSSYDGGVGNHIEISNINFINNYNAYVTSSGVRKKSYSVNFRGDDNNVSKCFFYDDLDLNKDDDYWAGFLCITQTSSETQKQTLKDNEFDIVTSHRTYTADYRSSGGEISSNKLFYHEKDYN